MLSLKRNSTFKHDSKTCCKSVVFFRGVRRLISDEPSVWPVRRDFIPAASCYCRSVCLSVCGSVSSASGLLLCCVGEVINKRLEAFYFFCVFCLTSCRRGLFASSDCRCAPWPLDDVLEPVQPKPPPVFLLLLFVCFFYTTSVFVCLFWISVTCFLYFATLCLNALPHKKHSYHLDAFFCFVFLPFSHHKTL